MNTFKFSSVSFFCPAYYDEKNLPDLIPNVVSFLKRNSDKFEVLIINDGSPDNTGSVAESLAIEYPEVSVVHHDKNMGYTATLVDGFKRSKYEYVIYTDGDNQYDIKDIQKYLYLLNTNDVITGYAVKKAVSNYRLFQSWLFNLLFRLLFRVNFKDVNCSLKVLKREVIDNISINSNAKGAFVDAEIVFKAIKNNYKVAQFPVIHYERKSGIASGTKPSLIFYTIRDMFKLKFNRL